ncbi:hypothetical protein [Paenarthrobacter nicotinovorans]|uniref:hypothetical protein n=1 Tax=Paenarthrobacter nicotinovorans TaxID=29320 RepID=UPI00138AE1F1|nr:hypothetical protein [Paenarthrobacter nicotinovorans]
MRRMESEVVVDNWDARHKAPIVNWSTLEHLRIEGRQRHIVEPSGPGEAYSLDCLVEPRNSDVLIVALHGALNREVYTLPRFEWMATLQSRPESLLFLSDTALEFHQDLKLAWYTGDSSDNLTARYGALIRTIAVQCGASRVVLLGFSGGGFAALALAPLIAGSIALAFSPQVSIGKYYGVFADAYATALYPEFQSFDSVEAEFPLRVNLAALYSNPSVSANFVYVQNSGDSHHLKQHFTPFREVTGKRPGAHFILEHESDSHTAPSKELVNKMLDDCLALRIVD